MKTEMWSLSRIKPYENNPRHNNGAVDAVARSIAEFGFRQPIVVDEADVIIVGHTRFRAAEELAMDKVPVHVAKGLTPEGRTRFRAGGRHVIYLASPYGPTYLSRFVAVFWR